MDKIEKICLGLHELVIFRNFLTDSVGSALLNMLETRLSGTASLSEQASACAAFAAALFPRTTNLSDCIRDFVCSDDHFYIRQKALSVSTKNKQDARANDMASASGSQPLEDALLHDLQILSEAAALTPSDVLSGADAGLRITPWETSPVDLNTAFRHVVENLSVKGFGIYAQHFAFSIRNGKLVPVRRPDFGHLSELTGYTRERNLVKNNTLALLHEEPFCNVLLYGDAGTGKSSTVKALVGAYADQGLRLIEIRKDQLFELPDLIDLLSELPLKFIIFIDDLSLADDDNNFSALKAIIEGSVTGCSKNIAIYATSNRRHLVKETLSDRNGNDIHVNDTMQELMSLSARFGLTVTFLRPEKELYLDIVKNLSASYGLDLDGDELEKRAEAFAIRAGGRSPRTAKQFVLLEKSQSNS